LVFSLTLVAATAQAQSWSPPPASERCPSPWGANDERGHGNLQGPAAVLRAAQLIRTGEVIELGHVLSSDIPMSPWRQFTVETKRTSPFAASNRRGSNEETVIAELGHVGTQFDGFAHQSIGDELFNCIRISATATRTGFTRLGVENVGAIMTRAVLLDIAALKGVERLGGTYEITVDDLEQALERHDLEIERGDAVILHTGWGTLFGVDNAKYQNTNPGIGVAAAQWLAARGPILVGADTSPVEVRPNPDPEISLPVHQIMLAVNGIHLLESMKLDELAASEVYEFALIVEPLKIKGGTGSSVAPIAVH